MHRPDDVTGLVLAGGGSTRFGRDKALAALGGVPFVALVHAALAAHAREVLVATGTEPRAYPVAARVVLDPVAGGGPLAGLAAGLADAETPWLLSAAVDLPYLTPAALRPLLAAPADGADVLVATDPGGGRQPTCALWRTRTVEPVVAEHVAAGRLALRDLLDRLAVREVRVEGGALHNVNAPGDLGPADG
ncbi:molybdenum cofactor guanylyltransferase [Rubrivirga sp.]|uniref:molybdenum cofactor guanylyltransferase n=1 Tax=Rubrivirga sp. TaxID=1885344 RepID=UPI003B52061B